MSLSACQQHRFLRVNRNLLSANTGGMSDDEFDVVMDMMSEYEDQDFEEDWQISGITSKSSSAPSRSVSEIAAFPVMETTKTARDKEMIFEGMGCTSSE